MEFGRGSFQWDENSYTFDKAFLGSDHKTQIHLGLPQWGTPEWKASFYTDKCQSKNFLIEYAQRLDCVELSSTFYSEVSEQKIQDWKLKVNPHFKFLPKWPQRLTHDLRLLANPNEQEAFIDRIRVFGENLGTTILQLPPLFSSDYKRTLFDFVKVIPEDFPLTIEFRDASWFRDFRVYPLLEKYLCDKNRGMVIADTPSKREVFHLSFTGTKNVIRYLSDQNPENDQRRLNLWRIWLEQNKNLGEVFFTLHRPDNEWAPELINLFSPETQEHIDRMNQKPQTSLF